MQFSSPTASFGYYRGSPQYGGYGSGQGPVMSGNSAFAPGQGVSGTSNWSPTILYLFVLVIAEMLVFGILSRHV